MPRNRLLTLLGIILAVSACSQAPRAPAQVRSPEVVREPVVAVQTTRTNRPSATVTGNVSPIVAQSFDGTDRYRIGVDDRIQISVWRNPELSVEVPVRPDGFVSAPLIGDVRAGGMTPTQVAKSIEKKLETYIRNPKVSVILTNLVSHEFLSRVRVTGAVNKPLSLAFRQGMSVLDIVLEAGGLSDFAVPARAKLYRKNHQTGESRVMKIRLDQIIHKGDLSSNVVLRAGDVLTIPERRF